MTNLSSDETLSDRDADSVRDLLENICFRSSRVCDVAPSRSVRKMLFFNLSVETIKTFPG